MGIVATTHTAMIANGASLSGPVLLGDKTLSAIIMPAAWTAAGLSFQASDDNGTTWHDMYDSAGNEVTLTPAAPAGKRLSVDPAVFHSAVWIKVRSGLTGAPVVQLADRALTLITVELR